MSPTSKPPISPRLLVIGGGVLAVGIIVVGWMWLSGGSDRGPELAAVKGTVTYQGASLTHGQVAFTGIDDKAGYQALGFIQPDGTFELTTQNRKGALLGQHVVTVYCREKMEPLKSGAMIAPKSLIPETYGDPEATPFRFEVKRGKNEFPLELK